MTRRSLIASVALLACTAMLPLGGCSSSQPVAAKPEPIAWPEHRPVDFTLVLEVTGPAFAAKNQPLPRSLRPGRYIVESDGTLRAAATPPPPRNAASPQSPVFPPVLRQLSAGDMDQLWRFVVGSGLLDSEALTASPPLDVLRRDRTSASMEIAAESKRRWLQTPLDRASDDALAAERCVDRIAALAWIKP